MKKLWVASASIALLTFGGVTAASAFPSYGLDTSPYILITLNSDGTASIADDPTVSPTYDGADDTYVGVINNSGHTVSSLSLTADDDIFGFDGDGIDVYGAVENAGNPDTTGYGGPNGYFTNINTSLYPTETGTVNFLGGIANGGTDYFSLEEALTAASFTSPIITTGVPEPMTWAMMLVGFFGVGATVRRRRGAAALA